MDDEVGELVGAEEPEDPYCPGAAFDDEGSTLLKEDTDATALEDGEETGRLLDTLTIDELGVGELVGGALPDDPYCPGATIEEDDATEGLLGETGDD